MTDPSSDAYTFAEVPFLMGFLRGDDFQGNLMDALQIYIDISMSCIQDAHEMFEIKPKWWYKEENKAYFQVHERSQGESQRKPERRCEKPFPGHTCE
jgi:hypothetical protein